MFKRIPRSKKEKKKVVKITTEKAVHVCTEDCFKARKRPKPAGLRRMTMGDIYYDHDGRCYKEWGPGEWMEVTGLTFAIGPGGLHLLFEPKEQLHIHERGGRTIEVTTTRSDARVGADYHAREAAKKLKRQNFTLKDAREYLGAEASEVIPKAPKRRIRKNVGRGAPGIPRTALGRQVVKLIREGKSRLETFDETILWARNQGERIAGPHQRRIKKQVDRWWKKKKFDP